MKIGASIFTGLKEYNLEDSLNYLKLLKNNGYEMIFTSIHINEADKSIEELNILIDKAYEYGIKVVVDVSKDQFFNYNISDNVYCYRLDYGFSTDDIVKLSKKYHIELNASTITKEKIEEYISYGINIENISASFNYYPKLYTGHSLNDVFQKTQMLKKYNICVSAFLPSFYGKRPPMYEGLPSVETHRVQDLSISIEELKAIGISIIYFGDAYASKKEIELLSNHNTDDIVLDTNIYCDDCNLKNILNDKFKIRSDYNDFLLRFKKININCFCKFEKKEKRSKFDLTIDNELFKRYANELNLVLKDLPYDDRTCIIGHVKCSDIIVENIKKIGFVRFNLI